MHRIDTSTRQVDKFGTGKDGFTNGSPGVTPPTQIDATMFDALQEELANAIEGAGATLAAANTQLLNVLRTMINGQALDNYRIVSTGVGTATFNKVAVSPAGNYLAVGAAAALQTGTVAVPPTTATIEDTSGWAARTADGGYTGAFNDAAWALSMWIAVGAAAGPTAEVQTSAAGVTWAHQTLPGTGWTPHAVLEFGSLAVVVGSLGWIITSPDGTTWTQRTPGSSFAGGLYAFATDGTTLVAVGQSGEIQTSTNGTAWTRRLTGLSGDFTGVAYGNGVWLAVGSAGAYKSTDAVTWTAVTIPAFTANACVFSGNIVWTGKVFAAMWKDSVTNKCGFTATVDGTCWYHGHNTYVSAAPSLSAGLDGRVLAVGSIIGTGDSGVLFTHRAAAF